MTVVIDDHLLRDVLTGERSADLGGIATGLVTTGLWLFRLSSSLAAPGPVGKLSAPVKGAAHVDAGTVPRSAHLVAPRDRDPAPADLAWSMAGLQHRHRQLGHKLSAVMTEALAAAHTLAADIAVAEHDVGPNLRAASLHDGISFHVL